VFADSIVLTTALLKNCIKVPKLYEKTLDNPDDSDALAPADYDQQIQKYKKEAFKRGVMMFDDYNYDQYNKFILHDDPKNIDLNNLEDEDVENIEVIEEDKSAKSYLNKLYLNENHGDNYTHSQFDLLSEEEKADLRFKAAAKRKWEKIEEARTLAEERLANIGHEDSDLEHKEKHDNEEDDDYVQDDLEYDVFYNKFEIAEAKEN